MSVAIIGGNECMIRRYTELCKDYKCKAKVYSKMTNSLKNMGGTGFACVVYQYCIAQDGSLRIGEGEQTYEDCPVPQQFY